MRRNQNTVGTFVLRFETRHARDDAVVLGEIVGRDDNAVATSSAADKDGFFLQLLILNIIAGEL